MPGAGHDDELRVLADRVAMCRPCAAGVSRSCVAATTVTGTRRSTSSAAVSSWSRNVA